MEYLGGRLDLGLGRLQDRVPIGARPCGERLAEGFAAGVLGGIQQALSFSQMVFELPVWLAEPRTAVIAIGEGLGAMHDALPVADCPFSWMARDRITAAQRAAAAGRLDTSDWAPEHRDLGIEGVLARVQDIPPADKLVVCHGDACAPNTLIAGDGRWSGHVDLGDLGVADRWADLAIATWSTEWNYGPGWEQVLLDAYGIKPDEQRTRYYRLLWKLA